MSKDTEIEMKAVVLNELDQGELRMTGDGPGAVKFTGLSKEELMKVAGTPGWVRTRWVLLILFWLCKPIPEMNWWNQGPLYQISDLDAFNHDKGIKGEGIHTHSIMGNVVDHTGGIRVLIQYIYIYMRTLVPPSAAKHRLGLGVDGVQVSGLAAASSSPDWSKVQGVLQDNTTEHDVKKSSIQTGEPGKGGNAWSVLSGGFLPPGGELETLQWHDNVLGLSSVQAQKTCSWFKTLSALRGEERSLLHRDNFPPPHPCFTLLTGFLLLFPDLGLPQQAKVKLSSDPETLTADISVSLDKLLLGPAVLLTFLFV
uniref:Solute carrier family 3 member 2 N-terminal domain-containing protein n=1 Tax=Oncorhynchus tshawytscha TaxID=74940 RepID=A0AAZ3SKF5_ONCTS